MIITLVAGGWISILGALVEAQNRLIFFGSLLIWSVDTLMGGLGNPTLCGVVVCPYRSQINTVPHLELPDDVVALQTLDDLFGGVVFGYSDVRTRCDSEI